MPRAYRELIRELRQVPGPVPDYERMERNLMRAARRQHPTSDRFASLAALAAATALTVAVLLQEPAPVAVSPPPGPGRAAAPAPPARVIPGPRLVRAAVTAAAGTVEAELQTHVYGHGAVNPTRTLTPGAEVIEGHRIRTAAGRVDFRLATGTGWSLQGQSAELSIDRLREDGVLLKLEGGRLHSQVAPLGPDRSFIVAAGDYRISVRGTRFAVGHASGVVEVAIAEGEVELTRGDAAIESLSAPAHWSSAASQQDGDPPRVQLPVGLEPGALNWPLLSIERLAGVVDWSVGDAHFPGGAELALRAPPGDVRLLATMDDGRELRTSVRVDPTGTRFDPRELRPGAPEPKPRAGRLPPGAVQTVVRRGLPGLRRCYEQSLKLRPKLEAQLRLRIRVDRSGRVDRVDTTPPDLPAEFADCLVRVARGFAFEAPVGGSVSLEVPLDFSARSPNPP